MDIQNPISINILNQKITPLKTMGIGQPEEKGMSLFQRADTEPGMDGSWQPKVEELVVRSSQYPSDW